MTDRTRLLAPENIWPAVLDALLALHDGDLRAASDRLAADPEDLQVSLSSLSHQWLPWYAAVWAETCVLAGRPDVEGRLARAVSISGGNPIAASIVERAQRLAEHELATLDGIAERFLALDCPYQAARTRHLAIVMARRPVRERTPGNTVFPSRLGRATVVRRAVHHRRCRHRDRVL
jgi:hypothetical protein